MLFNTIVYSDVCAQRRSHVFKMWVSIGEDNGIGHEGWVCPTRSYPYYTIALSLAISPTLFRYPELISPYHLSRLG